VPYNISKICALHNIEFINISTGCIYSGYNKDFTEEDGLKAGEMEAEFGEMGGYEAESNAASLFLCFFLPLQRSDMSFLKMMM
jgi:hypothetical protein